MHGIEDLGAQVDRALRRFGDGQDGWVVCPTGVLENALSHASSDQEAWDMFWGVLDGVGGRRSADLRS